MRRRIEDKWMYWHKSEEESFVPAQYNIASADLKMNSDDAKCYISKYIKTARNPCNNCNRQKFASDLTDAKNC